MNTQIIPLHRVVLALAFFNRDMRLYPINGFADLWVGYKCAFSRDQYTDNDCPF